MLCIGECMAELAPTDQAGNFKLGFAGDTYNTAWYLAGLHSDLEVAYFTAVGDDALSEQMCRAIEGAGVDIGHVRRVPGKTVGLYLISLDQGERRFTYWRGQSAARDLAANESALARAMQGAALIFFSGITLAILDPAARQRLFRAIAAARAAGSTIAFDPNLRPQLWADATEMRSSIMDGAAQCDICLPSFADEAAWFEDADPAATIARYAGLGVPTVVVKNGPDRVHYRHDGADGMLAVPRVDHVVDTTAAGDSFNAAVFAGLMTNAPMETILGRACELSGHVIKGKGALVPIPPSATFTQR